MNNKEIQKIKVHIYQTIQEIKLREYEDHEKIEDRYNEYEPGETNYQVTMDMLSTFIHDIESRVIFKQ